MFDQAEQAFGALDILMNNAGVDASGTHVADLPTEVFDRAIRVNVYGYFFCCRRFAQIRTAAGAAASSSTSPRCTRTCPTQEALTTTARRAPCGC
jgi:NAD(P)-dependent dehydrogenase (short-subunit alcohol dehydrogenase family)